MNFNFRIPFLRNFLSVIFRMRLNNNNDNSIPNWHIIEPDLFQGSQEKIQELANKKIQLHSFFDV